MAARLQLKLGLVAEHDRLADSPDTLVVVEPSVGSVARSKGHLYLLVTSRTSSRHALEATRLAAETIRNEYYYDESAGIRVCLQKAIATANKRLVHQADRLGLKSPEGNGPIGVGVAVVRGSEMYVATVGPAEAYLIRQARLSTLPDPHRERGLPSSGLEPDVWRGEISVGDSLVLVSPNIVARLGADELKDAMLTLHPQSAMEHLHARFVAADGSGSDGAIAFEATEVAPTTRARTLVPVRPAEPLAGAPDRSPIPLADNVQAAGGRGHGRRRQRQGRRRWRASSGSWPGLHDFMPRRKPAYRRVTPLASRRETQRRAAVAALALVAVVGGLGLAVYAFGGTGPAAGDQLGQRRPGRARQGHGEPAPRCPGPGIDLVADDPEQGQGPADRGLRRSSTRPRRPRSAAGSIDPLRAKVVAGLDRLYGVVPVASTDLFTFKPEEGAKPFDLTSMVRGPDGAPYVIDAATKTVYRIDLKRKKATAVVRAGREAARHDGGRRRRSSRSAAATCSCSTPRTSCGAGAPSNDAGKGTLDQVNVNGATQWGDDVTAIGTFLRDPERGPLQPVRHRSVGAADPGLLRRPRRQRLPGQADGLAGDGARRRPDDLDVHRRRHVHRRGRRARAVHLGQERRLGGRARRRRRSSGPQPTASLVVRRGRPARRARLRLRPARTPGSSLRQGERRLLGQYRLAGGATGLGGPARPVRHARASRTAPRRSSGCRRTGVHQAVLEPVTTTRRPPSASPARRRAAEPSRPRPRRSRPTKP